MMKFSKNLLRELLKVKENFVELNRISAMCNLYCRCNIDDNQKKNISVKLSNINKGIKAVEKDLKQFLSGHKPIWSIDKKNKIFVHNLYVLDSKLESIKSEYISIKCNEN